MQYSPHSPALRDNLAAAREKKAAAVRRQQEPPRPQQPQEPLKDAPKPIDAPWRVAFDAGQKLLRQGNFHEAEAEFIRSIRIRPTAAAYAGLGFALNGQERYAEAEVFFREAIGLDPNSAAAHHGLAISLWHQGRYREAEGSYRVAARLNPEDAMARGMAVRMLTLEGHRLATAGQDAQAEAVYRRVLNESPNQAEARAALVQLLLKRATEAGQQDPQAAEAINREALRLDPQNAPAVNNLGVALLSQGKLKAAEAAFRDAVRLSPQVAVAWSNLALVLERQGRRVEASQAYRQAAKLDPNSPAVRQRLQPGTEGRLQPVPPGGSAPPGGGGGSAPAGGQLKGAGAIVRDRLDTLDPGTAAGRLQDIYDRRGVTGDPFPTVTIRGAGVSDPVVPPKLKSDALIGQWEHERDAARAKLATLQQRRQELTHQPRPQEDMENLEEEIRAAAVAVTTYNVRIQNRVATLNLSFKPPVPVPGPEDAKP